MRDDFERVLCTAGARGLYESNYLKANDPSGEGAFWIKYNLLAPRDPKRPRIVELWAVYWRGPGEKPLVVKRVVPGDAAEVSPDRIDLRAGGCALSSRHAAGEVEAAGHRIGWSLDLEAGGEPIWHFPLPLLYRASFPRKKILTPRPQQVFRGSLTVDDSRIPVDGWVGLRGHNWGTEHAHSYAYGNASLWHQPGEWLIDAFTARIRVGPALSPWLSLAVVRGPKVEHGFNAPSRWINRTARVEFPRWSCAHGCAKITARTRWEGRPDDMAGLRYLHPDGRLSYCYNTKFATLELEVEQAGGPVQRRTSSLAELEFLTPTPIEGIELHGDESLPS